MPNLIARDLRRNATDAEKRLWKTLRSRQLANYKFRRQHPIGKFITDFVCIEHHLIIEADGGQHAENEADARRTALLEKEGWKVIRFWNNDILTNTNGVLETILNILREETPSPSLSLAKASDRAPPSPASRARGA